MYLYVQFNKDWENKYKYGFTKNYIRRLLASHEQHSYLSEYIRLYKIEYMDKYISHNLYNECDKLISICGRNTKKYCIIDNLDLLFLRQIHEHIINDGGSTEFLHSDGLIFLEIIILYEFNKLGINVVKEYSEEELNDINKRITDIHNSQLNKRLINRLNDFTLREYQKQIIDYSIKELNNNQKIYIELATGGGKTFIVYNILRYLVEFKNIRTIIIISPLIKINNQNISEKYINILGYSFKVLDYSQSSNIDYTNFNKSPYKLLTFCTSSKGNVKLLNITNKLENYVIWYDEAHYAIEQGLINKNPDLMKLNSNATFRIFTSASPNRKLVLQNISIFGMLYKLIGVRDLINLGYLCDVKTYIFDIQRENVKIINYVLNTFNEQKKKYGFSFHSRQKNAFNLFRVHVEMYNLKESNTTIKPFLLIGVVHDSELMQQINTIELNYDFRSISLFEREENSVGYVVQQYSMGYDFPKLDFVVFPDNKTSYQDIVQCLGRGLRIYKDKYLSILIPAFISEENINNSEYRFKQIINVIKYLIKEVEIDFEEIKFDNTASTSKEGIKTEGEKYEGVNNIRAKLLEILELNKRFNYNEFVSHLIQNNINNHDKYFEYYNYIKDNSEMLLARLPENPFVEYSNMAWRDVDKNRDLYYDIEGCINTLVEFEENESVSEAIMDLDHEEKIKYLHNIDNKLPIMYYQYYYGTKNKFPLFD